MLLLTVEPPLNLPDMRDAAREAWELVDHGLIHEADFRDFMFTNPRTGQARVNPDFFAATVVADAAASCCPNTKHKFPPAAS